MVLGCSRWCLHFLHVFDFGISGMLMRPVHFSLKAFPGEEMNGAKDHAHWALPEYPNDQSAFVWALWLIGTGATGLAL